MPYNVYGSRLPSKSKGEEGFLPALTDTFGTFLRSTVDGLSLGYAPEEEDTPLIGDTPQLKEGIGKTATSIAGNIVGSSIPISAAASFVVAPVMAALGATAALGAIAPIAAGTIAAMGYEALKKGDMTDKAIGVVLAGAFGGIASKLKLNKLAKSEKLLKEGASKILQAKASSSIADLIGDNADDVIEELSSYSARKGLGTTNIPVMVAKAVEDFQRNPSVKGQLQKTLTAISPKILDENGVVKKEWLDTMQVASSEIQDLTKKIFSNAAYKVGNELAEEADGTIIGKTSNALKKAFKDPANVVSSRPGGSQVYQTASVGAEAKRQMVNEAGTFLEPIYEKLANVSKKNKPYYKAISNSISYALEDRKNAIKYFTDQSGNVDDFAYDAYKGFEGTWDYWKGVLKANGIEVLDNYYTHTKDLLKNPAGTIGKDMPAELAEKFFKERTGNLIDFERSDIIKVYKTYENFVSRKLAFDPAIKAWKEGGKDPIVANFLNGVITSRREPGGLIDWVAGQRVKNLITYNPFSALTNLSQQYLASANISPEAKDLSRHLTKIKDPKVINFLKGQFAKYADDVLPESISKKSVFDKLKFFEMAEGRNWLASRSMGIAQEMSLDDGFKSLVEGGMSKSEAILNRIKDPDLWKKAMVRGQDLANKTQFSTAQGFKPGLFELTNEYSILRIPLQFARFQVSNLEALVNTFRFKGKEYDIMRRGFQDEVNVVDRLRSMRTMYKGAKKMISEAASDSDKSMYKAIASELKQDMGYLVEEVNRIEPRTWARSAHEIGKMIAGGSAPKLARIWLKWGLAGYIFNKATTAEKKTKDVSMVAAGQIPGLEFVRGMDLNPRYVDPWYNVTSYSTSLIPGVGMIDTLIPGRPITKAAYEYMFKKEKKEKKAKKFRRF